MDNELMPMDSYAQGGGNYLPNNNDLKTVKTLGIVSIVTSIICCWIYGIPGLVTGIIGLVLGNGAQRKYQENPQAYYNGYLKDLKSAKTLNIIGICLSGLWILGIILYFVFILAFAASAGAGEFPFN